MTPAFEHHDTIARASAGTWLRAAGPVSTIQGNGKRTITPGTVLRVVGPCRDGIQFGMIFQYDAGGPILTCRIEPEWFHCLETAAPQDGSET